MQKKRKLTSFMVQFNVKSIEYANKMCYLEVGMSLVEMMMRKMYLDLEN